MHNLIQIYFLKKTYNLLRKKIWIMLVKDTKNVSFVLKTTLFILYKL
jgi:hypothetical protein